MPAPLLRTRAVANEFATAHGHRAATAPALRLSRDRRADRRGQDVTRTAARTALVDAGTVRAAAGQSLSRTLLSRHDALCAADAIALRFAARAAGPGSGGRECGGQTADHRFHDAEERHLRA